MKNTVYYLGTCDTCKRILKQLGLKERGFRMREIKTEPLTEAELEVLRSMAGSYEALFSRQSRIYKAFSPQEKTALTEEKMKAWILKEYTFLKRPVIILNDQLFAGNAPAVTSQVEKRLA